MTALVDQSQRYDPDGFVEPQRNPVGGALENRSVDGRTLHEDGVRVRALACCRQQNSQQHGRGEPRRPPDHGRRLSPRAGAGEQAGTRPSLY